MDALVSKRPLEVGSRLEQPRPSDAEAERAVRTLIRWIGDDPDREGLVETPARVLRACGEWFAGYADDPGAHLARTFEEVSGYEAVGGEKRNAAKPQFTDHYFTGDYPTRLLDKDGEAMGNKLSVMVSHG